MFDEVTNRRGFLALGLSSVALAMTSPAEAAIRRQPERALHLYNTHTGESLKTVYWGNGRYQSRAIAQISRLLRDHRSGTVHAIDPHLLDLIAAVQNRVGAKGAVHVISGYRSPTTNAMMAQYSDGVATHSMHTKGKAVDIRMPGHAVPHVGRAARSLRGGGVGLYPESDFVHIDTGPIRLW
jgi:uncharacterized protein YcbK (DUF882 family)